MITLFASLSGFIVSIVPEMVKLFTIKDHAQYQLKILEKQIEYSNKSKGQNALFAKAIAKTEMYNNLYATYRSGINWVDALNGSVRPMLAYSFFIMYGLVKYIQYTIIAKENIMIDFVDIMWTADDQAIFAGIISFYFGQRSFSKIFRRVNHSIK
ncbi:MAG: hypothetical protein AB8B67_03355 [Rickettsiaceae bacterium]